MTVRVARRVEIIHLKLGGPERLFGVYTPAKVRCCALELLKN